MIRNVSPMFVITLLAATLVTLATSWDPYKPQEDKVWTIEGLRLYQKIAAANPGRNLVISPLAISIAMRMFFLGTNGTTKAQIETALKLPANETIDERRGGTWYYRYQRRKNGTEFSDVKTYLPLDARYSMLMANRLYGPKEYPFRHSYLQEVGEENGVLSETLDFRADPDGARRAMNTWVKWNTLRRVNNIFPPGSIANDSGLILVSGLAFRAAWKNAFDKELTMYAGARYFYLANGSRIVVSYLVRKDSDLLHYASVSKHGFEVLKIPFLGKRESIYFVLPYREVTLAAVESLLETTHEQDIFEHVEGRQVLIAIPRFLLGGRALDLNEPLKQLGIVDAFDAAKAGFSNLSATAGLALTKVVHQSSFTVDDHGTGFQVIPGPIETEDENFNKPVARFGLDRPFLFLVMDEDTGTVILRGRVMNPWEDN